MLKAVRKKINKTSQDSAALAKIASTKQFAGSCTGVKYPCSYHCKRCYFDSFYVR